MPLGKLRKVLASRPAQRIDLSRITEEPRQNTRQGVGIPIWKRYPARTDRLWQTSAS